MESQEHTGAQPDFIDAFMHIDQNVRRRAKLAQSDRDELAIIIEARRNVLLGSGKRSETEVRADIAEWETELVQLASVIDSIPNREITSVFRGILHASGITSPELIDN